MENNQTWADPSALGNLIIGILILCQILMMLGKVDILTRITVVPWVLAAFPVLLIVVAIQFMRGDLMGATVNGLLGCVLMGQNFVKGIIDLIFLLKGMTPPQIMVIGGNSVDAVCYLLAGIILLFMGFLAGYMSKAAAISVWSAAVGFLCLSMFFFGYAGPLVAMIGTYGLVVIGVWCIYSGIAMLMNGMVQKQLLPLGRPFFGAM